MDELFLEPYAINDVEMTTAVWREFHRIEDRDMRDCIVYAAIMFGFYGSRSLGGAMYEVGPTEVVAWEWQREFGNLERWLNG